MTSIQIWSDLIAFVGGDREARARLDALEAGGGGTPTPSLSISAPIAQNERNSGTTAFAFLLTLARNGSTASFPYSWAVTGSGANPANAADFGGTFPSGTGTFDPGETTETIVVLVAGDTTIEPNETFTLTVTANGLNTVTSTGTINNDDASSPTSVAHVTAGQSNMANFFTNAKGEYETAYNAVAPAGETVLLYQGATSGSALLYAASSTNYWYREDNDTFGPCWDTFVAGVNTAVAAGRTITTILWNQGESDIGLLPQTGYQTRYSNALITKVFAAMRTLIPDVTIVIVPMNRNGSSTSINLPGYALMRALHVSLAANATYSSWLKLGPEIFDQPDDGGPHATSQGYKNLVPRLARYSASLRNGHNVLGGVNGPRVNAAQRDGQTITVGLLHDGGNDVTPTSAISGFRYFDNGAEISVTAALRASASSVTLTLATLPAGTDAQQLLVYGYRSLTNDPQANILRDNQTVPLPLRYREIVPTNVTQTPGPTPAPAFTTQPSISGTPTQGQLLTGNDGVITDGSVSARQWRRGSTDISGANGATYTPTADDVGANLTYRVTATGAGGSTTATSAAVGPIAAAPLGGTFSDNFNRANENLEGNANWQRLTGTAGLAVVASNVLAFANTSAPGAVYAATPPFVSATRTTQVTLIPNGIPFGLIATHLNEDGTYFGFTINSGGAPNKIAAFTWNGSALSPLPQSPDYAPVTNGVYLCETNGAGEMTVKLNGTVIATFTVPEAYRSAPRAGFHNRSNFSGTVGTLDNWSHGPIN